MFPNKFKNTSVTEGLSYLHNTPHVSTMRKTVFRIRHGQAIFQSSCKRKHDILRSMLAYASQFFLIKYDLHVFMAVACWRESRPNKSIRLN